MLPNELCSQFISWQCRIRQISVREDEGRPSAGMCPKLLDKNGAQISAGVVMLIVRENSSESTEFFKFQVQKHNDPRDVYKKGLTYLQSTHYHRAIEFSDEMTALFFPGSELAGQLVSIAECVLVFKQFSQTYTLPCRARKLHKMEPPFSATLWHNRLFNPNLPGDVEILGFQPNWDEAIKLL